ncbi:protein yellow-like [Diabrotica virgifera virgifera]|uniref:Protein yellow-like n=1 Tax=Diabrotica virgifera virgifera TaxID=50390 RepID=A0ABM5KL93_DIAVI|nr:protein yellow-like [Diabrotica virgifera virgifera]
MKHAIIASLIVFLITGSSSLQLIKEWNFLTFDFPPQLAAHNFKPEATVPTGIEITNDRIFISIPRLRSGVPATLTSIPINNPKDISPVLQAYPDWTLHGAGSGNYNCSGLISVYRTRIDSCNRLWVLDAGTLDTIENFRRACPPKILIFDLKTDQVVRTIVFPREVIQAASIFTNLIIDESIQGKCDSAFVYISDTIAPGIVVYDGSSDKTWRVSDPSMYPNPDYANINIAGEQFSLMDGIIGLAHSPQVATVFYQAVATDRIFSIPTATLTKGPPAEFEKIPIMVAGKKSSQGLPLAINEDDNTLFFSPMTETSIAAWNVVNNNQQVLVSDPVNLQFVAELRWKNNGYLYILSSRFHKFFKRTVTPNETNIRILRIPLKPTVSRFSGFSPNFYFK